MKFFIVKFLVQFSGLDFAFTSLYFLISSHLDFFQMFGSIVLILSTQFMFTYIGYIGMFSICGTIGFIGVTTVYFFKPK